MPTQRDVAQTTHPPNIMVIHMPENDVSSEDELANLLEEQIYGVHPATARMITDNAGQHDEQQEEPPHTAPGGVTTDTNPGDVNPAQKL